MDGTLCQGECFNEEAVLKAKPVQEMIDWVNEISKTNFVVIYTARRDFLLPATLRWLRVNSVSFQAISNNKTPCDLLIDDRAINPKDLLNGSARI